MRPICCTILLAAVCGCAGETEFTGPPQAAQQPGPTPQCRIEPLPTAGPGLRQGAGIDNAGLVAGFTGRTDGTRQAALRRGGVIPPLGTLPGGAHSMERAQRRDHPAAPE